MDRGRPRPAFLRALGKNEPPEFITVDGDCLKRLEVFKHDSWAATALYQSPTRRIVCKFNRRQNVCGVPMGWLGRQLARREAAHYRRLQDIPFIPRLCGRVYVNGGEAYHAVAHEFIEGRPLGKNELVSESFDAQLRDLITKVHQYKVAYVDLHKRENIIVGTDGYPYLIDFQVSWISSLQRTWWSMASLWILKWLQAMDRYHLEMHEAHHRRLRGDFSLKPNRPWWIKVHRLVSIPLRQSRRWLMVKLGVRQGLGTAGTEHCPEQAFR